MLEFTHFFVFNFGPFVSFESIPKVIMYVRVKLRDLHDDKTLWYA